MAIGQSLAEFIASSGQCDSLIGNAHKVDHTGVHFLSQLDREQVTVAAFLNLFISWEQFLEAAIIDFMMGDPTLNGQQPVKYVNPTSRDQSGQMVVHINKYFDFANHEYVKKLAKLYFDGGYPFDGPLNSILVDLVDLKTIRNACAHLSSTTRTALQSLATRIFGQPHPGISVYGLLTAIDPRVPGGATTVYAAYRDKLLTAAHLISQG
ncbi:hypothetical protein [Burkholderia sp. B21-007]|uniref:hypothetical protein n=1 Tax=Burkholderia sp. B21-007 TaxID=2890407 RepID=UPI001E3A48C6|nr:hypothetical protein [Burkholderia sp. B21-007]UEP31768.1 hypothetical protein LMA01_21460 [Burkholderia sp. B21-007]